MPDKGRASCPTLKTQLWRGAIGIALLVAAGLLFAAHFWVSLALVALSIVPLRGCPLCWIVETCEVGRNQPGAENKTDTSSKK